jgi:hypothetical protein
MDGQQRPNMAEGGRHVPAWNNENKIFLADNIK